MLTCRTEGSPQNISHPLAPLWADKAGTVCQIPRYLRVWVSEIVKAVWFVVSLVCSQCGCGCYHYQLWSVSGSKETVWVVTSLPPSLPPSLHVTLLTRDTRCLSISILHDQIGWSLLSSATRHVISTGFISASLISACDIPAIRAVRIS